MTLPLIVISSVVEGSLRVGRDDKEWDRDDEEYSIIFDYYLVVREIIAIYNLLSQARPSCLMCYP